jgi:hypothetical protein
MRQAEQADWNERVEAVYDLCRQVRADAKSKKGFYEPLRPSSVMQTEQVASINKRRGRNTRTDLREIARGIPFFATLLAMAFLAVVVFW